ncbi:hypothetical protein F5Y06DRAFT_303734 [Hypoxylon sp. FL0890]|nr:hypothetical protein F5Y06DRAFT_303734 [Hypoxylon sp. FL0890]
MVSIRSDEAVKGSAKPGSHSKKPEDPEYARQRVTHYLEDSARPCIIASETPSTRPNSLYPGGYSTLFDPVDNLPGGPATGTPARRQLETTHIAKSVQFTGAQFDGSLSASTNTDDAQHLD